MSTSPRVTKAVIPAAGLGTRFLPATKASPKEMLPVVDKPAIQYVVEEAVRAGLNDVLMITGRNKRSLEDHFDRAVELELALEAKGDKERLASVQHASDLADVHYVRQGDAKGLGHAVLAAWQHVGHEPFAVLLGDDLIDERDHLLEQMVEVQAEKGGSVIALMEVPHEQISLYGCAAVEGAGDVVRITGLVEKPPADEAPSDLAVIGRYVLSPTVFDVLRTLPPGRGGEYQLTDALQELIAQEPVHGVVFRGRRYDTGDRLDYLKAVVQLAAGREDLGPPLLVWLMDAHGCVLTEDVVAPDPLPAFDNSSMDGYAVRAADVAAAREGSPVVLPVTGDVAAGPASPLRVQPGVCVRIMTGAMMPAGADAVVPVEWTDGGVAQVAISRAPAVGAHVRGAGEDVAAGETVLVDGTYLGAVQVGLAAAVGRSRVLVRPRPRVVVVSTGSELTEAGQSLTPGRIYDSNSLALTAAAVEAGAIAYRVGIVPDDPRQLAATLEDQLVRADVLVTSGGVSVGAYDVVKEVLSRLGTVDFDRVAMQPGMPQGFGTIGPDSTPVFGLPGNPVSALVSFEAFVRPALRKMLGATPIERPRVRAATTKALVSPPGKRSFLRVALEVKKGAYVVTPVSGPGSHLLAGLSRANALAIVPEDVEKVAAGEAVDVLVLERRGR